MCIRDRVTGTERYTEKDVIEASGIQRGDNLFLLNKYEAARSIAEQLPYIDIEDIRIRRELPDTLLIDVAECGTPVSYTHLDVYKRQGGGHHRPAPL